MQIDPRVLDAILKMIAGRKTRASVVGRRHGHKVWRIAEKFSPAPDAKLAPNKVREPLRMKGGHAPRCKDASRLFNATAEMFHVRPQRCDSLRGWHKE